MPKLWESTVDAHRVAVRAAAVEAAASLVKAKGLRGVTMSEIASEAGIGRATLYKYFSTADEVFLAWHERHIAEHLAELHNLARDGAPPIERLERILGIFLRRRVDAPPGELAAALHAGRHVQKAESHLRGLVVGVIREAVAEGTVRGDVSAEELADFALRALDGRGAASKAKLDRRLSLALDALRAESFRRAPG